MFKIKAVAFVAAAIASISVGATIVSSGNERLACADQMSKWHVITDTNNYIRSPKNARYFAVELAKTRLACGLPGDEPRDEVEPKTIPSFVAAQATQLNVIEEAHEKMEAAKVAAEARKS